LIAMRFGAKGPASAVATACATGNHAIGDAMRAIQYGTADVMLAGGAEAIVVDITLAGFCSIHALSTRNEEPERASRPFDSDRDGFVFGEGAGVLVLESLAHASERDARIYAEVVGYGTSSDAFHITAPHPQGEGAANAMIAALRDAELEPRRVDYINAHGTSTPHNDRLETLAIKRTFGEDARRIAISSTKSMTGHLFGAAGAIEAIATVLALHHSILPPTINYETPDPDCDLDYVPNTARRRPIQVALSNGFGFGGINATLAFQYWPV
jgi:3-oxoacyl-[acyl-carrier-protein] synthase II